MSSDSFGARSTLEVERARATRSSASTRCRSASTSPACPYSIKVLLENVLRLEDGVSVSAADVEAIAGWDAEAEPSVEIPFQPARVLMQDFTGVPAVVDLAAMRDAMEEIGGDPAAINPLVDVDLVIDHSVQVDAFGNERAFARQRRARLRAQPRALLVPQVGPGAPSTTSASCRRRPGSATRSTSSTSPRSSTAARTTAPCRPTPTPWSAPTRTRRWSTASACSAGASAGSRPRRRCSASRSRCCCRRWSASSSPASCRRGRPRPTSSSPSTEMLRERGVVSKFVEFFGPGLPTLGLADRATLGNMSPEFGSTCAIFPVDAETLRYLDLTGRPTETIELVDAYAREQGMFHDESTPRTRSSPTCWSSTSATVEPSDRRAETAAGPGAAGRRPRRPSSRRWRSSTPRPPSRWATAATRRSRSPSRPPTRRPRTTTTSAASRARRSPAAGAATATHAADDAIAVTPRRRDRVRARPRPRRDRRDHQLHQHLQPERDGRRRPARPQRGRARACSRKPWVKTSLAPGSTVVTDYLEQAGPDRVPRRAPVQPRRLRLHHLHRQLRAAAPRRSRRRSPRRTWRSAPSSPATATSRAGSTRTSRPTTWPARRWSSPTRSPAAWTST